MLNYTEMLLLKNLSRSDMADLDLVLVILPVQNIKKHSLSFYESMEQLFCT